MWRAVTATWSIASSTISGLIIGTPFPCRSRCHNPVLDGALGIKMFAANFILRAKNVFICAWFRA
jgi:hypothetical protein